MPVNDLFASNSLHLCWISQTLFQHRIQPWHDQVSFKMLTDLTQTHDIKTYADIIIFS